GLALAVAARTARRDAALTTAERDRLAGQDAARAGPAPGQAPGGGGLQNGPQAAPPRGGRDVRAPQRAARVHGPRAGAAPGGGGGRTSRRLCGSCRGEAGIGRSEADPTEVFSRLPLPSRQKVFLPPRRGGTA